jgi:hypothetical protein
MVLVGGGFVQADEAVASLFGTTLNSAWGRRATARLVPGMDPDWGPSTAWQLDPFGHSATTPLVAAAFGQRNLVGNRIAHGLKSTFKADRHLEFVWGENDVLTHVLPQHYASPRGFDFESPKVESLLGAPRSVVRQRARKLVAHLRRRASQSRDPGLLMVLVGDDFRWSNAEPVFQNWELLMDAIPEVDSSIHVSWSTPDAYFAEVRRRAATAKDRSYPALPPTVDFFPYEDNARSHWVGFYTTRPWLKEATRAASRLLHASLLTQTFVKGTIEHGVARLASAVALVQHHDGITGTAREHVANDYVHRLTSASVDATAELVASLAELHETTPWQLCDDDELDGCVALVVNSIPWPVRLNPSLVLPALSSVVVPPGKVAQALPRYCAETRVDWSSDGRFVHLASPGGMMTVDRATGLLSAAETTDASITVNQSFSFFASGRSGAYLLRTDGDSQAPSRLTSVLGSVDNDRGLVSSYSWAGDRFGVTPSLFADVEPTSFDPLLLVEQTLAWSSDCSSLEINVQVHAAPNVEVAMDLATSVASGAHMLTDSSALFMTRTRIAAPILRPEDQFFPSSGTTALLDARGTGPSMALLANFGHAVSLLAPGHIQLLLHRTPLADDGRGLGQSTGKYEAARHVKHRMHVLVGSTLDRESLRRSTIEMAHAPVVLRVRPDAPPPPPPPVSSERLSVSSYPRFILYADGDHTVDQCVAGDDSCVDDDDVLDWMFGSSKRLGPTPSTGLRDDLSSHPSPYNEEVLSALRVLVPDGSRASCASTANPNATEWAAPTPRGGWRNGTDETSQNSAEAGVFVSDAAVEAAGRKRSVPAQSSHASIDRTLQHVWSHLLVRRRVSVDSTRNPMVALSFEQALAASTRVLPDRPAQVRTTSEAWAAASRSSAGWAVDLPRPYVFIPSDVNLSRGATSTTRDVARAPTVGTEEGSKAAPGQLWDEPSDLVIGAIQVSSIVALLTLLFAFYQRLRRRKDDNQVEPIHSHVARPPTVQLV